MTYRRAFYELRPAWATARIARLTEALRDAAIARLVSALPGREADILYSLAGRRGDGARKRGPGERVRIVPLPSAGEVGRLVVEVPRAGPLKAEPVFAAFSGLSLRDADGVVERISDPGLEAFGVGEPRGRRRWRTVTPIALPAPRGRGGDASPGELRRAVSSALRHAGVRARVEQVHAQRAPFEADELPAGAFAAGARFEADALWHLDLCLEEAVSGPLVLGNGRFLGLGLMRPVRTSNGVLAFSVTSGLREDCSPRVVAAAFRRAVMRRFQEEIGRGEQLPPFVTGHDRHGRRADERLPHLSFAFDPESRRLLLISPCRRDRRPVTPRSRRAWATLEQAMAGFSELRATGVGRLRVEGAEVLEGSDRLLAPSRVWVGRTPYVVNRHYKRVAGAWALVMDVEAACGVLGLPPPEVRVRDARGVPGAGLTGWVALRFEGPVAGPILLGRTRHKGGGLFSGRNSTDKLAR